MKRGVLFALFLLSSLVLLTSFSINFVLAIEGKCVGGAGPEGQFLTKEEGGCCLNDECCNYPATQAWCNQAKKDFVPSKGIENSIEDEDLFKDKGKVVGKIESLEGKVEVRQEDGTWEELKAGDEIKFLDHIRVGKGGKVKIRLIDDTQYTMLENSYLVIDEFVYDSNPSFSERILNKLKSAFRWVNEKLNKRFDKKVPDAVVGTRG